MNSKQLIDHSQIGKGAIVVGVYRRSMPSDITDSPIATEIPRDSDLTPQQICELDLNELIALLGTLNITTLHRVVQHRDRSSPYLGKGKCADLKEQAQQSCAGLIAVDGSLSGSQIRTMERAIGCQIIDREGIILEIFSAHAQTSVARLQVEMAKWQYLMPRLVGAWSHFSRQAGGGVRSRGMGEKQIEIDRRIGRSRIAQLRKKLAHIEVESTVQRKLRKDVFKVALVGYTNSGKTTLMNGLSTSETVGENQLFATLSAKTKSSNPHRDPHILFTDTVGFIGRLPHALVASFRSTLAETLDADLLVHVVDMSHPRSLWQLETSQKVLAEIGAASKQMITVFNKVDLLEDDFILKKAIKKKYPQCFWMSAHCPKDVAQFSDQIRNYFLTRLCSAYIQVPVHASKLISQVFEKCIVLTHSYETQEYVDFEVKASPRNLKQLENPIRESGGSMDLNLSSASHVSQHSLTHESQDNTSQDVYVL